MVHDLARHARIQQQIRQVSPRAKRRADVLKRRSTDDATAPPDPRNGLEIEVVAVFLRSDGQERHTLRVGDDHRGIERAAQLCEKSLAVARDTLKRTKVYRAGLPAFLYEYGQVPNRNRQIDRRNWDLQSPSDSAMSRGRFVLRGDAQNFIHQL